MVSMEYLKDRADKLLSLLELCFLNNVFSEMHFHMEEKEDNYIIYINKKFENIQIFIKNYFNDNSVVYEIWRFPVLEEISENMVLSYGSYFNARDVTMACLKLLNSIVEKDVEERIYRTYHVGVFDNDYLFERNFSIPRQREFKNIRHSPIIYFMAEKDGGKSAFIKIGKTQCLSVRARDGQTFIPRDIDILLLIEGGPREENLIHRFFKDDNVKGRKEWFTFSERVLETLDLFKKYGIDGGIKIPAKINGKNNHYSVYFVDIERVFSEVSGRVPV